MPRVAKDIVQLSRSHTQAAVKTLVGIMNQSKAAPAARVQAANSLLDRGWGKPKQALEHTGKDGESLVIEIVKFAGSDTE